MTRQPTRGLLISDFNISNLSAYLSNNTDQPEVECRVAPYGQITQTLLGHDPALWDQALDFVVVWSRPESVLECFATALSGIAVDSAALLAEVDSYCDMLLLAKARARAVFVPTWTIRALHQGHGMLDLAPGVGAARLLMQANSRLLERMDGNANVFPLNAAKWLELAGDKAFNPRLWYLAKVPFGNEFLKACARDIKAALRGLQGRARKLVVLDLDDTLWGGIVGDVGWQNLVLGGHDPVGEALLDFQRELKGLARRGIVLGIVSKNDERVALEAIREHPEMALREKDFAGWRINWRDKAQNVADLAAELNLGLDAVVFIDDNPIERARVREALPEVLVPDWPDDKKLYPQALHGLDCFDKPMISDEDRQRQQMYAIERQRVQLKAQVSSLDEWLRTLDLTVTAEPLNDANVRRIAQLLNKTNQLNLSTRRLTEAELLAWSRPDNRWVWGISVSDKFGDSGLTGILSLEIDGRLAHIVDFVLSCRVMGRKVEETMLHLAVDWIRSTPAKELRATYRETERNKPCREFLEASGMRCQDGHSFSWSAEDPYPLHPAVTLIREAAMIPATP